MQIIEELETWRRTVYCGAIGYIGFDGNMDTSIAIRTLVHKEDRIYFWAGGALWRIPGPTVNIRSVIPRRKPSCACSGSLSADDADERRLFFIYRGYFNLGKIDGVRVKSPPTWLLPTISAILL